MGKNGALLLGTGLWPWDLDRVMLMCWGSALPMGWEQNGPHGLRTGRCSMLGTVLSQDCALVLEQNSCPQARDDAVPMPACWGQCHIHMMSDQITTC